MGKRLLNSRSHCKALSKTLSKGILKSGDPHQGLVMLIRCAARRLFGYIRNQTAWIEFHLAVRSRSTFDGVLKTFRGKGRKNRVYGYQGRAFIRLPNTRVGGYPISDLLSISGSHDCTPTCGVRARARIERLRTPPVKTHLMTYVHCLEYVLSKRASQA